MSILFSFIKDILASKSDHEKRSALKNLDTVTQEKTAFDADLVNFQKILAKNPDHIETLFKMGNLIQKDSPEDAIKFFKKVISLDSNHIAAKHALLFHMQSLCIWNDKQEGIIRELRKSLHKSSANSRNLLHPHKLFTFPGVTAEEHKLSAIKWCKTLLPPDGAHAFKFSREPNKKIRIAYLSGDLHQHPVAYQIARLFESHDRKKFHISAYSYGPDDGSRMRRRLVKSVDNFHDIRDDSDSAAAKKIHNDHTDILVDLTGYTGISRSKILALRPAPIQVNFLGYAGTMGCDFVDYLISDQFVIPESLKQYYSEKVVWLPDCFMPIDNTRKRLAPPARQACGLPTDSFVFCSFNNHLKISAAVFNVWCQLLKNIDSSVLWLPAAEPQIEENLKSEATKRGVDAQRIIFAAKLPENTDHLARLQCADLFLDTTPYNAHSTCSDALWMGLPVLTCTGETFQSRVAGSMLTALDLPELVTYNLEDYYTAAMDLANNRNKLDAIRNKISALRDSTPLFDSSLYTRNLEKAYIKMLDEHAGNSAFAG